ncbi:MAG: glycosyltransferase [Desulfovibrio sp.]|jgi:GT2 family glycosyltransferase|nr:glycosyltransferase [Desulfovibrio sp.]
MEKKRQELTSLFRLARLYKTRGSDERFAAYVEKARALALDLLRDGAVPATFVYSTLYRQGCHEPLFELAEAGESGQTDDALLSMATAAAFARNDPRLALALAERIGDAEQRCLRRKTAELWADLHAPLTEEPRVHLLVLTHNRAACAERSLRLLGETAYRNYAVYIADNGSGDGTREIALRAREFFPSYVQVAAQAFPVNIGRPAGHNWLVAGHDHSAAEFIAIADDDLTRIPPDWLTRMVRTAQLFPGCACVGGKILVSGWPAMVQCGPFHMEKFGHPNGFTQKRLFGNEDLGQFDYIDLVEHVAGCLHIFDRRALEEIGLFDIRFSPSQFVDVEHHLRLCLAGKTIVFNGLISCEHQNVPDRSLAEARAATGNVVGNLVKLIHKHDEEEVRRALETRHQERAAWLEGDK